MILKCLNQNLANVYEYEYSTTVLLVLRVSTK